MFWQKILLYVTPAAATVTTVAVVSFNAIRKKKVNPEMTDEEYQVQWGNGAPDQYKDK
jgi:cytochrome c-type biogenesis protein CcmH/NrfF